MFHREQCHVQHNNYRNGMIIEPDLMSHPKFIRLKSILGDLAMEYLVRLWAHCQQNKRGHVWPAATADYVEVVCTGRSHKGTPVFQALRECAWVHERQDGIEVHDWDKHNASLVARWNRLSKPAQAPAQIAMQTPAQTSAQTPDRTGQDRTGQDREEDKKEKALRGGEEGGNSVAPPLPGAREASQVQWAALNARLQVAEVRSRNGELGVNGRGVLKKMREALEAIQKKQAHGDFSLLDLRECGL